MNQVLKYISKLGFVNSIFILGTLLNIMSLGYLFGYIAIVLIFLRNSFLKAAVDRNLLLLFVFAIVYALFYATNAWKGSQFIVLYMFIPPTFYLWGKYMAGISVKTKTLFLVLIILTVIYSLPALISVTLNIIKGGFVQPERNIPMFWGGEIVSATQMAAFFVFNMCIPALLLVSYKEIPKILLMLLILIFILSVACVLRLGSRTQLAIIILSLLISLIIAAPKMSFKQNFKIYSVLMVIIFFITTQISFDLDSDMFASFAGRMKDDGAGDLASGGGRTRLWAKSLDNLVEHPLGWDLEEFGYSHNLWLDALRVGGIISFVLLILYFLKVFNLIRKIIMNKIVPIYFQILCLTYIVGFFSLFMVEPGIDGTFTLFILFCLFVGLIRQHYYDILENAVFESSTM
ncbi:hypothetical protein [Cellulophaga tyrosinoxydans]|uniref:O-antigen ligase like membrane protein n=1 Tax=Cellulophaga tyrosinoxydans TaxID=504486 RepID=A0A1W2A2N2_9FLAO|nr:hypothetical protein [Cellulophaga tyrosinoxydans]SMC54886.1 hypothetical protein SAMN05660703_1747 [Cellulophaga tyrosinoxydans]